MKGKPWTPEEDDIIANNAPYMTDKELFKMLSNRPLTTIRQRRVKLGITRDMQKVWTKKEDEIIKFHYPDFTDSEISEVLDGRTVEAIRRRRVLLGLTGKQVQSKSKVSPKRRRKLMLRATALLDRCTTKGDRCQCDNCSSARKILMEIEGG